MNSFAHLKCNSKNAHSAPPKLLRNYGRGTLRSVFMELSKLRELADKMPKASFACTFVCVLERIPTRYFPNVQAGTMCRLVAMLSENPELVSG